MNKEEKPLLATGDIVGSYKPLYAYWEECEKRGKEPVKITRSEIEYVEKRVKESGRVNLETLKRELSLKFIEKVDPDIAYSALFRLGLKVDRKNAQKFIAEILAGWTIEACDVLGIIKVKKLYKF